jgi:hypothetical protein
VASPASRRELVRFLVLGWIADDYENLTVSIAGPVTEDGARCGLAIERVEIVQALVELVELGWAKAYVPQSNELVEIDGMPPLTDLDGQDGALVLYHRGRARVLSRESGSSLAVR